MRLFSSEAAKREYFRAYEAMLARWPVRPKSLFVDTSFGRTHVLEAGDAAAPPLLLLPAISVSAAAWYANAGTLSQRYRVLAVDIIGDAGRSELLSRPSNPAGYANWLAETVSALGATRPAVAGHSYGGWLTMLLALHRPEIVGPIMLLAPAAGLAPFHWYIRLFLTLAERLPVKPSARSILRMQAHKGFVPDEAFVALMETMTRTARTNVLFPVPLTDQELSSIQARCLVLIGAEEMLYDSRLALQRALVRMANAEGELVNSASHLLIMERPDEVNRRLLAFLVSSDEGAAGSRIS